MERMDRDMPFLLQYEHVAWFEMEKSAFWTAGSIPQRSGSWCARTTTRWYRPSRTW